MLPARLLLCVLLAAVPVPAFAADACRDWDRKLQSNQYADRIAGVACHESRLWYRPFIDGTGRLASATVSEAESGALADGVTPVWQRVVAYWRDSGLLWRIQDRPGAAECNQVAGGRWPASSCRAFLVDTPWSAAFVSWVMVRAGVPGFRPSASHVDYVREAFLRPDASPFRFADPSTPAVHGDLLCYVRSPNQVFGAAGLRQFLGGGPGGLNMHCDVVVANGAGGDGLLSLVGGNVLQGVTLRQLPVNRAGQPWPLPLRAAGEPPCGPDTPAGCSLNRQDWAVLLQLKPLPPATAPAPSLGAPQAPPANCCIHCVLGAVPAVPRCPRPGATD